MCKYITYEEVTCVSILPMREKKNNSEELRSLNRVDSKILIRMNLNLENNCVILNRIDKSTACSFARQAY